MSESILIIDDDESVVAVLQQVLEAEGFSTRTASSAAEGLAAFQAEKPRAVLLDLGLPDDRGQSVLEKLTELQPNIPVVVMTGQEGVEKVVECMRLGAADYLPKPLTRERLLEALTSCELRALDAQGPESIEPFDLEEKRIIQHALEAVDWRVNEAARRLRLGRATIYRKIERYGLKRP